MEWAKVSKDRWEEAMKPLWPLAHKCITHLDPPMHCYLPVDYDRTTPFDVKDVLAYWSPAIYDDKEDSYYLNPITTERN